MKIATRNLPSIIAKYRKSHQLPAGPHATRDAKEWRERLASERADYLSALREQGLAHLTEWEDDFEDGKD